MTGKVRIYAGGKVKGSPFEWACASYLKRIHLWSITLVDGADKVWGRIEPSRGEYWVALEESGTPLSSPAFGQQVHQWIEEQKIPTFFIGASTGLPPSLVVKTSLRLSLASMTMPHLLARVFLLEQLYRGQQALLRHPYSFV